MMYLKTWSICLLFISGIASLPADEAKKSETPASPPSELSCARVFGDDAIFQQGIPIPVWGRAVPGATITATFSGQSKTVKADASGDWEVRFDALEADRLESIDEDPEGRDLSVSSELNGKQETLSYDGILIGEVWLCSGQSNMQGRVRNNRANQNPDDDLMKSNLPAIRVVEADKGWLKAVPASVGEFTRVGFTFAREIQRELKVPVGLLSASVGGTSIETWIRLQPEGLVESPKAKPRNYGGNFEKYIDPLTGYGMSGCLWYQGEGNASEGYSYFQKMEALITDWRAQWQLGDFPFYYVQLAGIGQPASEDPAMGDGRAAIREAQRQVMGKVGNTGMATAIEIGGPKEHPPNKTEIGMRLAAWSLHEVYGKKDVVPSGPLYRGFEIEGDKIRISFEHGEGLMLAEKQDYIAPKKVKDGDIPWLSIQAKDGTWHWADGEIDGADLIVSSAGVSEPVAVRYAYTNRPAGLYLYNGAELPASPFTTEEFGP